MRSDKVLRGSAAHNKIDPALIGIRTKGNYADSARDIPSTHVSWNNRSKSHAPDERNE